MFLPEKEEGLCLVPTPPTVLTMLRYNHHNDNHQVAHAHSVESTTATTSPTPNPLDVPPLHVPLPHRPDVATRLLVQDTLGDMMRALAADMQSWQQGPAMRAGGLLPWVIGLLEGEVAFHVHVILPAICQVCFGLRGEHDGEHNGFTWRRENHSSMSSIMSPTGCVQDTAACIVYKDAFACSPTPGVFFPTRVCA